MAIARWSFLTGFFIDIHGIKCKCDVVGAVCTLKFVKN